MCVLMYGSVDSCSIYCPEGTELCVNELWYGPLGSMCAGFLGCVNETTPCNGECPAENPVISLDGKTCTPCTNENETIQDFCMKCQTGPHGDQFWCGQEEQCKGKTTTCNDRCPLPSFPIKDGNTCKSCSQGRSWCLEESKCYSPEREPCDQKCHGGSKYSKYCPETNTCQTYWKPCKTVTLDPSVISPTTISP